MNMEVYDYQPETHYPMICKWAKNRGLSYPPILALPQIGKVIPDHCALFLYQTDSELGFIEGLISNPGLDKGLQAHSIDCCVQAIETEAKRLGIKYLLGHFLISQVAAHAMRSGFKVYDEPYQLLSKEFN